MLTKPFPVQKTVIYTIIDWKNKVRGPENLVLGMGAETPKQCREMLLRLINERSAVSERNCIKVKIKEILAPRKTK